MYKTSTSYASVEKKTNSVSHFSSLHQLKRFCRLLKNQCFSLTVLSLLSTFFFSLFVVYTESACLFKENGVALVSVGDTLVWSTQD